MEAAELRIGNLVRYFDGNPITVAGIKIESAGTYINATDYNGTFYNIDEAFKPIPLNEEWLEKFGFSESPYSEGVYYHNTGSFEYVISSGYFVVDDAYVVDETRFVHQLQNLYFALTGQELTIKT